MTDKTEIKVPEEMLLCKKEQAGWFQKFIATYEKRVFARNRELTKESCERASKAWQRRMAGIPDEGRYTNEAKDVVVCQSIRMPFLLWCIYFFRDMVGKGEQRKVAGVRGNILVFYVKYLATFAKDMVVFKIDKYKARRLHKERIKEDAIRFEKEVEMRAIQIELLKKMNQKRN